MKTPIKSIFAALALAASLNHLWAQQLIGGMFTYQGQLQTTNGPVTGLYDFQFAFFFDPLGQLPAGQLPPIPNIGVTNGLFTVPVNPGPNFFQGLRTWVQIAVQPSGSAAGFSVLSPLQEITPTPYAIYAENAASIGGITPGNFWGTGGNNVSPGAKLGTTDAQPLVLIVGNQEAQRFEPTIDTPNIVGGYSGNSVAGGLRGATIGGGGSVIPFNGQTQPNMINNNGYFGTISGGYNNQVGGYGGVIGGGSVNLAGGDFSVVSGGQFNDAGGSGSSIGGGYHNTNSADYSTISGGYGNTNGGMSATIGGGYQNTCAGGGDTIAGGQQNSSTDALNGWNNTIGGGYINTIANGAAYATVSGGWNNSIQNSLYATVGGGYLNNCFATGATVGGGFANGALGIYSTIPGGDKNSATAPNSFAAGHRAMAQNKGSFVWADSQDKDEISLHDDEVVFRCLHGARFEDGSGNYAQWIPGGGDWNVVSDRNKKEHFSPVDSQAVLDKVVNLEVQEWNYKGYPQRHIGPMAQDFHKLFPLNDDDKTLNGLDLDGIELAAIKGLNRKVEDQRAELNARQSQIEQLKLRLDQLEKLVLDSGHDDTH